MYTTETERERGFIKFIYVQQYTQLLHTKSSIYDCVCHFGIITTIKCVYWMRFDVMM